MKSEIYWRSYMTVGGGTTSLVLGKPKLITFQDVICIQASPPIRADR